MSRSNDKRSKRSTAANNNSRDNKRYPKKNNVPDKSTEVTPKSGNYFGEGKENDPSWYNRMDRLVKDVTAISFANQLGRNVDFNFGTDKYGFMVPGACAIETIPIPGVAASASDGVNIAASALFQYIRKNLSTYASYAPADVMMYVLGIDNIYALYSHIKRAFGMINLYSSLNLYYNRKLFNLYYKFDDAAYNEFIDNQNAYRSRFNNLIYKAATLYLPTDFSITARHAWMYTNIFFDGNSVKSQLYGYTPSAVYLMSEVASDQGTALVPVALADTANGGEEVIMSMERLLTLFDQMIDQYRSSDSMNKIAADMRRAFENRTYYQLTYIDENYVVLPVKSEEVMSQIENTEVFPYIDVKAEDGYAKSWWITQSVNHNILTFEPQWSPEQMSDELAKFYYGDHLLNFHHQNPTSDEILVATRNKGNVAPIASPNSGKSLWTSGVDVIVGCKYLVGPNIESVPTYTMITHKDTDFSEVAQLAYVTQSFDWCPAIWLNTGTDQAVGPVCVTDFDNYTVVPRELLKRINDVVTLSMWSIPQLGIFQG